MWLATGFGVVTTGGGSVPIGRRAAFAELAATMEIAATRRIRTKFEERYFMPSWR
jgi:hypothetical protein